MLWLVARIKSWWVMSHKIPKSLVVLLWGFNMKECTGTGTHFTHLCAQIFTQFLGLAKSFARYPMYVIIQEITWIQLTLQNSLKITRLDTWHHLATLAASQSWSCHKFNCRRSSCRDRECDGLVNLASDKWHVLPAKNWMKPTKFGDHSMAVFQALIPNLPKTLEFLCVFGMRPYLQPT